MDSLMGIDRSQSCAAVRMPRATWFAPGETSEGIARALQGTSTERLQDLSRVWRAEGRDILKCGRLGFSFQSGRLGW